MNTQDIEEVVKKISNRLVRGDDNERTIGSGTFLSSRDERFLREEIIILIQHYQAEVEKAVIEEREKFIKIVNEVNERNESNGRQNACHEILQVLTPTKIDKQ